MSVRQRETSNYITKKRYKNYQRVMPGIPRTLEGSKYHNYGKPKKEQLQITPNTENNQVINCLEVDRKLDPKHSLVPSHPKHPKYFTNYQFQVGHHQFRRELQP